MKIILAILVMLTTVAPMAASSPTDVIYTQAKGDYWSTICGANPLLLWPRRITDASETAYTFTFYASGGGRVSAYVEPNFQHVNIPYDTIARQYTLTVPRTPNPPETVIMRISSRRDDPDSCNGIRQYPQVIDRATIAIATGTSDR